MKVEDIEKLFATGKFVDLGKGISFEVKKWGTDEAPLLMEFEKLPFDENGVPLPGKEYGEFVKKAIAVTLRRGIEDATDEDNLEVPLDAAKNIFAAVMEVNKNVFQIDDNAKKELIERLKKSGRIATDGTKEVKS